MISEYLENIFLNSASIGWVASHPEEDIAILVGVSIFVLNCVKIYNLIKKNKDKK